jgi:hypothetical protein
MKQGYMIFCRTILERSAGANMSTSGSVFCGFVF